MSYDAETAEQWARNRAPARLTGLTADRQVVFSAPTWYPESRDAFGATYRTVGMVGWNGAHQTWVKWIVLAADGLPTIELQEDIGLRPGEKIQASVILTFNLKTRAVAYY